MSAKTILVDLGAPILACPLCHQPICMVVVDAGAPLVAVDHDGSAWMHQGLQHRCPIAIDMRGRLAALAEVLMEQRRAERSQALYPAHKRPRVPFEQFEGDVDQLLSGRSPCCGADIDESRVIKAKGRYNGHGPRLCSQCKRVLYRV